MFPKYSINIINKIPDENSTNKQEEEEEDTIHTYKCYRI